MDELYHYGTPRHSGRYPYGSGERPFQGEQDRTQLTKAGKAIGIGAGILGTLFFGGIGAMMVNQITHNPVATALAGLGGTIGPAIATYNYAKTPIEMISYINGFDGTLDGKYFQDMQNRVAIDTAQQVAQQNMQMMQQQAMVDSMRTASLGMTGGMNPFMFG